MRRHCILLVAALTAAILAQETPAPKPEGPKEEPPRKPVYAYQGKPLKIDFACNDDDIASFGLNCSPDEPCDVFLELSAIETVGNKMFLTGNLHTTSVTLWSILLSSEDGGTTWTEAYERMRSTGLEHIQFIDFSIGWIGGQQLLALPRDPFFLITDDAGKTWRKKPIYSETRVGVIQQFAFETSKDGGLLIDRTHSGDSGGRHEYWESNTGGDSWSLREVSPRPIKLKRPRFPNTDWRVRADAPSQSFRVEHMAKERWSTKAGFLVKVGECRPPELKLAEPPPETETKVEAKEEAAGTFVIGGPPKKAPAKKKKRP